MTDADEGMNPLHFVSDPDPVDTQMKIITFCSGVRPVHFMLVDVCDVGVFWFVINFAKISLYL